MNELRNFDPQGGHGLKIIPIDKNPLVVDLAQKIENIFLEDGGINSSNIISISIELMQLVENYKGLTGSKKKDVVIDVINLLLTTNVRDKNELFVLKEIVDFTIPTIIDTIISIDKKEIRIKLKKCVNYLFCC